MHVFEFSYLKEKPYGSEYCGRTFNTASALQQYINKEHSRRSNDAGSGGSLKYKEYLIEGFDPMRYKCQYCGRLFKTESEVRDHIEQDHKNEEYGDESDRSFKYEKYLISVFNNQQYRCQYCGKTFKSEIELGNHIIKEHSGHNANIAAGCLKQNQRYETTLRKNIQAKETVLVRMDRLSTKSTE
ncbi:zinc finger protein Gfi-1b-like [Centruroides vittatus]|uniref:zinc finger protein Gfi-1b-like n=1 Tax=Centruroides vittatus TaxID=120091 RepID=UPI00350F9F03